MSGCSATSPCEKKALGHERSASLIESCIWSGPEGRQPPKEMKNAFCPATALHGSVALSFVIPSAAEGSAVFLISSEEFIFFAVYLGGEDQVNCRSLGYARDDKGDGFSFGSVAESAVPSKRIQLDRKACLFIGSEPGFPATQHRTGRVCTFQYGKAHEVRQPH